MVVNLVILTFEGFLIKDRSTLNEISNLVHDTDTGNLWIDHDDTFGFYIHKMIKKYATPFTMHEHMLSGVVDENISSEIFTLKKCEKPTLKKIKKLLKDSLEENTPENIIERLSEILLREHVHYARYIAKMWH